MPRGAKTIRNSCDKLWAQIIRSKGRCEKCGATDRERQLHPHHVYGRVDMRLRFDPRNGCCLCAHCHLTWAEAYPIEFADWFREVRPEDADYLAEQRRKGTIKRNTDDYRDLEAELVSMS
jgi:hypothetical protein